MESLLFLLIIVSAIWVYFDAKAIGVKKDQIKGFFNMGPGGWFAVTLLLWILGFPAWLAMRGKFKAINENIKMEENNVKKCPYCAELIKKEAIFCIHCRKDIPSE